MININVIEIQIKETDDKGSIRLINLKNQVSYNMVEMLKGEMPKQNCYCGGNTIVTINSEDHSENFVYCCDVYKKRYLQKKELELRQRAVIRKKILEKESKKKLQNEVYERIVFEGLIKRTLFDSSTKREPIPQDVMDKVWNRDNGKCVRCGSQENLEFDHVIPHSKGGGDSYRNLQILCKRCNIEKSNKIG